MKHGKTRRMKQECLRDDKSDFLRERKTQLSASMVQISTGGYTKSKRLAEKENCLLSFPGTSIVVPTHCTQMDSISASG
jgi:hypothetical protein